MSLSLLNELFADYLVSMPVGDAPFCQVVGRQFKPHLVACQHLNVILAHRTRQVSQNLMPFAYLHFERGVSHAFDSCPFDGDHILF